jgi:hypothetical protein
MNRDDIIRMARESGFEVDSDDVWITDGFWVEELDRFANLVAAAEREECAKAVEDWLHGEWHNQGVVAAMMIRERGAP